jgi:Mg2+-importing ATPase
MLLSEQVVPGDVVVFSAGSLIPADGIVLDAKDFFVNQAVLTGETFPVEKKPAPVPANASLAERTNCVFMGTNAGSGTAQVLIVQTGKTTVFGQVAERLRLRPPETEFERGIRHFSNLLTQVMLVMVVIVLAANVFLAKPLLDSLLFTLALAVGLTPELLPAITDNVKIPAIRACVSTALPVLAVPFDAVFASLPIADPIGTAPVGAVSVSIPAAFPVGAAVLV